MKSDFGWEEIVYRDYGEDADLLMDTIRVFSVRQDISTGSIQRLMKVSYARARVVLDKLIKLKFASPQIGARPCKVIKKQVHN